MQISELSSIHEQVSIDVFTSGKAGTWWRENWRWTQLQTSAALLFFTGADLAETKEPVEETSDFASFLMNLELAERDLVPLFDLAETKVLVGETTDLTSRRKVLLNLELAVPVALETIEEVLEETLPADEKDFWEVRSSSLPVAKPTILTWSSIQRPT